MKNTLTLDLSQSIDIVENISRDDFQKHYMIPQKPVIIRHFYGKKAPVYNWTFNYFEKELGDIEVGVFDDENEERQDDRSYKKAGLSMKFKDYLNIIQSGPTTKRLFLFNVFKYKKDLLNDFSFPDVADNVLKFLPFAFFGGQGAITRIHRDMDNSCVFLTELQGSKRIVLFDPVYSKKLYQFPYSTHTAIDVNHPDFEKYPALKEVQGIECTLNAGETIFMPAGWWHHIEYKSAGLGFAIRSLSPSYADRLLGLYQVGVMTHLDEILNKLFGPKWFEWKMKKALERA